LVRINVSKEADASIFMLEVVTDAKKEVQEPEKERHNGPKRGLSKGGRK
jgi:hypothetical protein